MISGMTGYGTSSFFYKKRKFTVVIRSVNYKFLESVINLPDGLFNLQATIEREIAKVLKRGRITVQLESSAILDKEPFLNKQLLFRYFNLMKDISRSLKIKQDVSLHDILTLPDVISFRKVNNYANKEFLSLFHRALREALSTLVSLRKKEGRVIYVDLTRGIRKVEQKLKLIRTRSVSIIEEQKTKLKNEELEAFLKSYNIAEEISRLEFHVKTLKEKLSQKEAVGKILDFITQEMQREINTLSAKFRDSIVSYNSVIIKDEIEKIREQLQNVE